MVELAMDHKASHREMTSVLLSDLYQECLTQTDICRGESHAFTTLSHSTLSSVYTVSFTTRQFLIQTSVYRVGWCCVFYSNADIAIAHSTDH